jgi:hypothetical protein
MRDAKYNKATSDPARAWQNYASITMTASGNLADYDVQANTTLFSKVKQARELMIRNSAEVQIKLNDLQEDPIDIEPYEGLLVSGLPINNLYVTTASGCKFRALLIGWN